MKFGTVFAIAVFLSSCSSDKFSMVKKNPEERTKSENLTTDKKDPVIVVDDRDSLNPKIDCNSNGLSVKFVDSSLCVGAKPVPFNNNHCYQDLVGNCFDCGKKPPTYSWHTPEEMCRITLNHAAM